MPPKTLIAQPTPNEQSEIARLTTLTRKALAKRGQRFTPFGRLLKRDYVELYLVKDQPAVSTSTEGYPVSITVNGYLNVHFGKGDWLSFFTEDKLLRSSGAVGLHRVVCAVSGLALDTDNQQAGQSHHFQVHHLDVNPINNRIGNLVPVTRVIHDGIHKMVERSPSTYVWPGQAWLKVVYPGCNSRQQRLQALLVGLGWLGPGSVATAAQIAAIVAAAGPAGLTFAELKERAKLQKIGEASARNLPGALVQAGLLTRVGHGRYALAEDLD